MPNVVCVHFSQLVNHCVTQSHTKISIVHIYAKTLVSAFERKCHEGDTGDEVVDYYCNLAYTSKQGK